MKRFLRTGALLCSTISIFLCGRFSARAQDGLLYEAACLERLAFDAADAVSRSDALVRKADCYAGAGEYDAAVSTLDRVSLFALDPDGRSSLLMRKALYLALAGRLDEFDAVSEEIDTAAYCSGSPVAAAFRAASEYIEGNRPALKSQDRAFRLSFLPPAAHIYAGMPGEGVLRAAGDASAVALGVLEALGGNWITAFLSCGIGLYECYWKGNADIAPAVDEYNKRALNEFRARLGEYLSTEGYCLCSPLWMP